AMALAWSIVGSCVVAAAAILFPAGVAVVLGKAAGLALAVPLVAFLMAATQLLSFIANREREYRAMATAAVTQQAGAAAVAIGAGIVAATWNGLLAGRIVGHVLSCGYLLIRLAKYLAGWRPLVDRREWWPALRAYRQFPLFNVPYSLAGAVSREFAILA